jgi:hypothetical protein
MNINSFTSEVVSAPSARRVSERKKNVAPVDKSFFKKTYKTKTPLPPCDTDNKDLSQARITILEPNLAFQKQVAILFPVLPPERRQSKAIHNYRAKKLKKMFGSESSMLEAITRHKALGLNLLSLQQFKRIAPNGKSIYATVRARDAQGRFHNSSILSKPHSSQYSTVDLREESNTETQTTAEGSFLSFLSLDSPNGVCTKQNHFDFDCMHEVSREAPRSMSLYLPAANSLIAAKEKPASSKEQTQSYPVIYSSVTPESNLGQPIVQLWDSDIDFLCERSPYSHFPCGAFEDLMEEDASSLQDFFGLD